MKKTVSVLFTHLVVFFVFIPTLSAGEVAIPNAFVSGTPVVAAEMNANFDAVESAIDDNAGTIAANSGNIAANSTAISTNATAIETNAANITSHASSIGTNTGDIAANATAISTNTTAITGHATDIAVNAANISANTDDIDDNAEALGSHRTSIRTHEDRLPRAFGYVNQYYLDDIHGTSNVLGVTWDETYSRYRIEIDGLNDHPYHFVGFANPFTSDPVFIHVSAVGGDLLVYIYDIAGDPIQCSFHWVVYNY